MIRNGTFKIENVDDHSQHTIDLHNSTINLTIAGKLTTYLNHCIQEEPKLLYNQNLLEQIYIPKDDSEWKTFYNARPNTKTSPIYKLLDTILNERLQQELYNDKQWKLNEG